MKKMNYKVPRLNYINSTSLFCTIGSGATKASECITGTGVSAFPCFTGTVPLGMTNCQDGTLPNIDCLQGNGIGGPADGCYTGNGPL